MAKPDYSKKWQVLISVAFGVFLATIDSSIVNISLPTFERELNTSFAAVQWVVLSYLLTITVLLLGVGRLADMIGRKRLYIGGFVIFMVGSFFCGISSRVEYLILFRVIQAIGGAFLMALGPALLAASFPPEQRGQALGFNGLAVSLGIILGPTLGGVILSHWGWHWIFFVNIPLGIIAVAIAVQALPIDDLSHGETFDFWGAILMFLSLISLLFSLTLSQNFGFISIQTSSLLLLFIVFLFLFIRYEKNCEQPVIDLTLFHSGLLRVNLVTGFLTFVASAGTIFLIPFYLQNILGYDPEIAGILMVIFPIMLGLSGPVAGWLSDKYGFRPLTVIGLSVLSLGYLNLARISINTTWQEFVFIYLPIGIGMGLFQSPNNSAILSNAAPNRLGVVSGLLAITRTLGQTSGIALISAIWTYLVFKKTGFLVEGATGAANSIQVEGMKIVFLILGSILFLGTLLSIANWLVEKKPAQVSQSIIVDD